MSRPAPPSRFFSGMSAAESRQSGVMLYLAAKIGWGRRRHTHASASVAMAVIIAIGPALLPSVASASACETSIVCPLAKHCCSMRRDEPAFPCRSKCPQATSAERDSAPPVPIAASPRAGVSPVEFARPRTAPFRDPGCSRSRQPDGAGFSSRVRRHLLLEVLRN